ncbi:MAG: nucleoside-diphosphate-sugar epimerase [Bacteroidia bacterium]|jgi:nucleoside-diphosphate-sugar epimerase
MKSILISGGTNFVGRNLVEKLLQVEDVELTLFNRGVTNAHLFPNVKKNWFEIVTPLMLNKFLKRVGPM